MTKKYNLLFNYIDIINYILIITYCKNYKVCHHVEKWHMHFKSPIKHS